MKNTMSKIFLLTIVSLIFIGCKEQPKPTTVYIPEINKVYTAEIGQNMFEKVYAILPKYKEAVKFLDESITKKYDNFASNKFFLKRLNHKCVMVSRKDIIYLIDYNCNGIFTHTSSKLLKRVKVLKEPIKYVVVPAKPISFTNESYKNTVLYQGKVDNKLNISFKEFVYSKSIRNFLIRDAYTQNIQYELDANGEAIIGFQGLRIKVLKATNFDITYQVIQDYN